MKESAETPTEQGEKAYRVGNKKPPKNRQFGQPEGNKQNPGGWKKEHSISYQYNKVLRMTSKELEEYRAQEGLTIAQQIAIKRAEDAILSIEKGSVPLNTTIEITDRTEGKARQAIDLTAEANINSNNPLENLTTDELKKLAKRIKL